jgi:HlyD family secretion protein
MSGTRQFAAVVPFLLLAACSPSTPPTTHAAESGATSESAKSAEAVATSEAAKAARHELRVTGLIQAVHSVKMMVPQIQGQFAQMTLTRLIPNGNRVQRGDLVATFDPAQQLDAARDAKGKYEDLGHQVEQKAAENRANVEKRMVDLRQAEGDLAKAELELQKGPVLAEVDRLEKEAQAEGARLRVASLKKSIAFRDKAEAAALRVLELQRDRQKIAMDRAQDNIGRMELHATLSGMVVHEMTRRGNSMGHAQEGDLMYRGYPLISIFDPSQMEVRCTINEPDLSTVVAGGQAHVTLDAYPDLELPVRFVSVSPVATSPLDTPIKSFVATFAINKADPHLLPDLSAAVVIQLPSTSALQGAAPSVKPTSGSGR